MNILSFQLTDGSTLKAASSIFLDVDLQSRMSSHTRLTMEPFPEKLIDNLASTSICTYRVRGEWRRVWGLRHTNSMQFVTVEKLQKSPKSRNCRNHQSRETAQIVCNALTSAHACAEVNNTSRSYKALAER